MPITPTPPPPTGQAGLPGEAGDGPPPAAGSGPGGDPSSPLRRGDPLTRTDQPTGGRPGRVRRLVRGRPDDPRWVRPALIGLLLATAVLYLWDLGASGWANAFYSASAQAGSVSWKAMFYASSDAGNSITVDKPPAAMWLMALSARIFGVSSWSILVPEALLGVGSVGLLYLTVRRAFPAGAALIAGAVLALTPVATLMFRFNNPDALLVLLLIAAAYATLRAIETASTRWLVWAGVFVSFGFLTKMLQALLIVPVLAIVYLAIAPTRFTRRLWQVGAGTLGLLIPSGIFIAIVELVPESSRPYIGGSQNNSILELTLGYNGLGRLTGNETGSVGGGGGGAGGGPGGPGGGGGGMWGSTGWGRMFGSEIGSQISWLIPTALVLLVAGLWVTRRAARTDPARAAFVLWGGWLLVTGIVFSQMKGIFHAYYTVALAPAVGALVGMGCAVLWRRRNHPAASVTLAGALTLTAIWSFVLLNRTPDWHPWIRWAVLIIGLTAALLFVVFTWLPGPARAVVTAAALVAMLLGPLGYSVATAAVPHTGSIPSAGPSGGGFGGGPGGGRPGGAFGGPGGGGTQAGGQNGTPPGGTMPGGTMPGGGAAPGLPGGQGTGAFPGGTGGFPGGGFPGGGFPGGGTAGGGTRGGGMGGGMGGLLGASAPSDEILALLEKDASSYTWVAASVGSNNAAGYQLATGDPVMAIGGFNGSDPSPTLDQFRQYVAEGRIHYFIGGGGFGGQNGGSRAASEIAAWVQENFTATTVGNVTLYDLTAPAAADSSDSSNT
ncbi:PMT family glycosyltransferase, 4-amino-4-deoxy-L-arabinose transferase [Frankia sp. EI5c]|uniref:ArnT family glycosyltransferase n=1 Tax=Frankia sp. EI5c TaxID=683316 RepID=UPI0007C30BEC|nr:glycosyltransferase family 39 protein [Frankia sp. EI5c]OAA25621.1 PMT family glycosyltransferase, 4-amino-4-deoxy-L-arabinose transferase [Frankia sp. EI5c]